MQQQKRNRKIVLFIIISVITLLIVVTGVLFSAKKFNAYCYNNDDSLLDASIAEFVEDKVGNRNIFVISEGDLINELEDRFENIEVVNIERIFPDTVKVNYSVVKEYAAIVENGMYYYVSANGRILSVDGGGKNAEKSYISLLGAESVKSTAVGDYLYGQDGTTSYYLYQTVSLLEKMGFKQVESFVKQIDLRLLSTNELRIMTQAGAEIVVYYPDDGFENKFRSVITAINNSDDAKRSSGIWRVDKNKVTYSA